MFEFAQKYLSPFPHGAIGWALKVWPFELGTIYTKDFWFSLLGELAESAMMEGFAIICAGFGESCDVEVLSDCVECFLFFCGPGW